MSAPGDPGAAPESGAETGSAAVPPRPQHRPAERRHHGDVFVDPYAWLRDRDDPAVLDHLRAENAFTESATAHTAELAEALFAEIKGRVQETDLSVPLRRGPWWYFGRTVEGSQYRLHCRVPAAAARLTIEDPPPAIEPGVPAYGEEVLLDENQLAEGSEYFALGAFDVSPDHRFLAYSTDYDGSERYTLRIRDLDSGLDLPDEVPEVTYGTAWSADATVLFYVKPDEAMRPYQLWRHLVGAPASEDVCVYIEDDEHYFLGLGKTKDERFIVVHLGSIVTDEVWVLPASEPLGDFLVVATRDQGVEYSLEHHGDRFVILTNAGGAENFQVATAPEGSPGREHWEVLVPHQFDVKLSGLEVFADHLVLHERAGGLTRIRVRSFSGGGEYWIEQPEAVGTVSGGANAELDTTVLRYSYTSMVTPQSVFDFDLVSQRRELRKQQPVLGGYDPAEYATERLWAGAPDGTQVPISLVWRRDRLRGVPGPLLLYGYGAYEVCMEPAFSSSRLSLLDRGFAFAIAHVRGGGEMGRRWYLEGKEHHKPNTFGDFIACARHLVETGWTEPAKLGIRGGSAGGLLVGAVLNEAPELFGAAVAEVPFVDALSTILDPSLPLTVTEWEEWGDPLGSPEVYRLMRSYSPYENVRPVAYPPVLVTAGLNDPRVSYWEPAKWVARLREVGTGSAPVLLKVEMGSGHAGPSGRYDAWRDEAFVLAFLLDHLSPHPR